MIYSIGIENGKKTHPQAIQIRSVEIYNYKNSTKGGTSLKNVQSADISSIIARLSISESIYSPTLRLKIGIKDAANFMESFPLTGQETIKINIEQATAYSDELIQSTLEFYVIDYPKYGKGDNENVSAYVIEAISKHAFVSGFKKICRSYKNSSSDEIATILENECEVSASKIKIEGQDISKSKGVLNIQTPLSAVEFLRKGMYDAAGAPFYLYETLNGNINLRSYSAMVDEKTNPNYKTYYDHRGSVSGRPDSQQAYEELSSRILDLSSNLKLSKYYQGREGAFASENNFLDWSNKSYTTINYNYLNDINPRVNCLEDNYILSTDFKIDDTSLNEAYKSNISYISKNDEAFPEDVNYGSSLLFANHYLKAYHELLDTYTHNIKLYGDINLNAGKIITLKIPKAIDPESRALSGADSTEYYDEALTGKYLITSVIHEVADGEYYSQVQVKRDSFSIGL